VKGKFAFMHTVKAYGPSVLVASHICNLGSGCWWVVGFTLMLLYPREKSPSICSVGGWLGTRSGLDAV